MALTVGEANSLNALLRWLTGREHSGIAPPDAQGAEASLRLLLRGADRTLMAGYREDEAGVLIEALQTRMTT